MATFYVEGTTAVKFEAYVEADSAEEARGKAVQEIIAPTLDSLDGEGHVSFDFITDVATDFLLTQRVDEDALVG